MLSRRFLRHAARLAIAGFLFAQVALAIAGCALEARSAAQAVAYASAIDSAPCHDGGDSAGSGPALCAAHCVTESHNLDKPPHPMPSLAAAPGDGWPAAVVRAEPLALRAVPGPIVGPPARIVFRTLRI